MIRSRLFLTCWLLLVGLLPYQVVPSYALPAPTLEITAVDPASGSTLAFGDKAYFRLSYSSSAPLRFQIRALRAGELYEVGFSTSKPSLHASGPGHALAWLTFDNATHIDEIHIELLDVQWQKTATVSLPIELTWHAAAVDAEQTPPRQTAEWIDELGKVERRKQDYLYDPAPIKHGELNEFMFLVTLISVPLYLLIQVQMLRRYKKRWRELATVPLVTILPLILFGLIIGYDFDSSLWLAFLFRATPFALLYLLTLWVVKQIRNGPRTTPGQQPPGNDHDPETP